MQEYNKTWNLNYFVDYFIKLRDNNIDIKSEIIYFIYNYFNNEYMEDMKYKEFLFSKLNDILIKLG